MKPEIITLREPEGAFIGFGLLYAGKLIASARSMHEAQRLLETWEPATYGVWDESLPDPDAGVDCPDLS